MTTAQTCVRVQTATLSTTTADSVTFSGGGTSLAITNHDAAQKLYFRTDGVTAVSAADENYVVLPGATFVMSLPTFAAQSGWDGAVGGFPVISIVGSGNTYTAAIF